MDIFNRPPAISEDTLQYTLYPPPDAADRESVLSLAALIDESVQSLLPNFIWHKDAFELKAAEEPDADANKWILEGRMRVGDSVDDEWCAVWLLREITSRWDIAVSVFDSDGEFLLIEAAEHLPSWVSPENAENRVWIYHSRLHLVPLSFISPPSTKPRRRKRITGYESDDDGLQVEQNDDWISISDALSVLRSDQDTQVPEKLEGVAFSRIERYPQSAAQHLHVAKAYLPVDIAKALYQEPSLVQKAVETFYTRDAIQLRAAHRMSRFPPQPSVLTPVRLTRTAYAQLNGQKFHPPKIFGQFKEREGTREWKWRDIGMKIACGFEMLYQEDKSRSETNPHALQSNDEARKDALRRLPEYSSYIRKLSDLGYFRGESEGSQLWQALESQAAKVFLSSRNDEVATRKSFAHLTGSAIARAGNNQVLRDLSEDSDDWLNIDADNFDAKLQETMLSQSSTAKDDMMETDNPPVDNEEAVANAQATKLKGLARKIESFVEEKSGVDGVVLGNDDVSEDEELSDFSDEEFPSEDDDDNDDKQNTNERLDSEKKEAMDKLVPGIDPSDYGKMPSSYYSNSQRVGLSHMDEDEEEKSGRRDERAPTTRIRKPILPRDDFDGVDSDDETDEDAIEDSESEEDKPQFVGEMEIDMEQEQEEFLQFTREALGITEGMWKDIVQDRTNRGAFVPKPSRIAKEEEKIVKSMTADSNTADLEPRLRSAARGPRPNVNPNLDSFEAVMEAMEAELDKAKLATKRKGKTPSVPLSSAAVEKGKGKAEEAEDEVQDIEGAMDAELLENLERIDEDAEFGEPADYGLIKNFLESFKSQGGFSGPVSNLVGRLDPGLNLPRDNS